MESLKDAKKLADEFTTTWARALNHSSFMAAIREHPSIASDFGRMVDKIAALESHNSSALKATLERIKSKLTDKEVGRYYHRQSMMGNRHKRMVDYALGLALEAVNFEIDSLLQQEGRE